MENEERFEVPISVFNDYIEGRLDKVDPTLLSAVLAVLQEHPLATYTYLCWYNLTLKSTGMKESMLNVQ